MSRAERAILDSGSEPAIARDPDPSPVQRWMDRFLDVLVGISVLGELVIIFGNIIARGIFNAPLLWANELGQLALTFVAFMGGALAYTRNEHIAVHAVVDRLPKSWRPAIDALVEWLVFVAAAITAYFSITVFRSRWTEFTDVLNIRIGWFVVPLTVGTLLIAVYALQRLLRQRLSIVLATGVVILALVGALYGLHDAMGPMGASSFVNWVVFSSFFIQLLLGVPVGFVLAIVSLMYLYLSGKGGMTVVPMTMQAGVFNYVLLAIPFFMMAGYIMTEGGLSRRLADFTIALVGRVHGGLLQVIVVTMYIFSGLSGSKVADVAAVGSTMNPMLKANGYMPAESAAVLASAAVMGETIPPSLPMLVLGSITTVSMGSLFMAGLLPAAVIAVCLMAAIYVKARRSGMKRGEAVSLRETGKKALIAIPALLVPVFLIGGIITGIATPTEVSTGAVVYSLILAFFLYRELSWHKFLNIMKDTSVKSGMVLFIISTASSFSWTLTAANFPHKIAEFLVGLAGHSNWLFMLVAVVILIVMGALLEGIPALLVFAPLLIPIVPQFGIDPLQFSIVMIIAMGLGSFFPPIGVGLYVSCSVSGTNVEETSRAMIPYLVVLFVGLLLVAFVPWFSLVVPKLLHAA